MLLLLFFVQTLKFCLIRINSFQVLRCLGPSISYNPHPPSTVLKFLNFHILKMIPRPSFDSDYHRTGKNLSTINDCGLTSLHQFVQLCPSAFCNEQYNECWYTHHHRGVFVILQIIDTGLGSTTPIAEHCGVITTPFTVTSSSHELTVRFHSDEIGQGYGLTISYIQVDRMYQNFWFLLEMHVINVRKTRILNIILKKSQFFTTKKWNYQRKAY